MGLRELDLSLGEFEALVTKAARGAGFPWGVAAEAGRAAREAAASGDLDAAGGFAGFLAARPAPCPLLAGLAERDGAPAPPETAPQWRAIRDAAAGRVAPPVAGRARVEAEAHAALDALAARTYAPATEESRAKGAG